MGGNNSKIMKMSLSKAVSTSKPYIRGGFETKSYSIVKTDFDIYFDNVFVDVAYEPRSKDASYGTLDGIATTAIFTRSGKIGETEKIYSAGKWYNVSCVMDMVNDRFFVYVDGDKVSGGELKIEDIAFWSINMGCTSSGGVNYYLDNIVTSSETPETVLGDVSYILNGERKSVDTSVSLLHKDIEKIIVNGANAENVTEEDFSIKCDGKIINCDIMFSGEEIYFTPKEEIKENSELYICLFGVENKKLYTSLDGTYYVKVQAFPGYAMIDFITEGKEGIFCAVQSTDDEDRIIDLQIIRNTPDKGHYRKKLSVAANGAAYIKAYVFGEGIKPFAKSVYQY